MKKKRINKNTKKYLKKREKRELKKKDSEWSKLIKERDKRCLICDRTEHLDSHHIIPREFKETRWSLENGITLCKKCHKFGLFSAHRNAYWFVNLLQDVGFNNKFLIEKSKELYSLHGKKKERNTLEISKRKYERTE